MSGDRPRVALVAHEVGGRGGMEMALGHQVRALCDEIDLHVVSDRLEPSLRGSVSWHRAAAPARPFPLRFAVFWVRAAAVLQRLDLDLVHVTGALVPTRADLSTIHFCHAGYRAAVGHLAPVEYPPLRRLHRAAGRVEALAAESWCFRPDRLRAFAAVSSTVAGELEAAYPEIPVTLVPNGIDHDRFRPDPEARRATREQLGLASTTVVAFVGGDWERKGLDLVLEAVARVGDDLRLLVIGTGDERRYRRRAAALGIGSSVRFLGRRDDVERVLPAADALVLPSEYETFSLVCYEAAACGLPVIATAVGGVTDLVDDATGRLVDRAVEPLASALADLRRHPEAWARRGEAARQVAAGFTWGRNAASIRALYHDLLGGERHR